MKKIYTKPDIMFEDFTLNTSIAAGCEKIIDGKLGGACGMPWNMGGINTFVFTEGVHGCKVEVIDGSIGDGFCYHNPSDSNNLFNS